MDGEVEDRIFALARKYNGVYMFNNEKKQKRLNRNTDLDTDMMLDVGEAEDMMEEFFKEFHVDRGNFKIETYYPDEPFSWNPFKKYPVIVVPEFTLGMLIESAKSARWLYD
ncbi:DUF1493 family protein [Enterobacteriaceae bacterium 89]|nr:DUF1493 family protein [Enterobacteriaceae bacterium 89]